MRAELDLIDWIALELIRDAAVRGRRSPSIKTIARSTSTSVGSVHRSLHRLAANDLITRPGGWMTARPAGSPPIPRRAQTPGASKREAKRTRLERLARIKLQAAAP